MNFRPVYIGPGQAYVGERMLPQVLYDTFGALSAATRSFDPDPQREID